MRLLLFISLFSLLGCHQLTKKRAIASAQAYDEWGQQHTKKKAEKRAAWNRTREEYAEEWEERAESYEERARELTRGLEERVESARRQANDLRREARDIERWETRNAINSMRIRQKWRQAEILLSRENSWREEIQELISDAEDARAKAQRLREAVANSN